MADVEDPARVGAKFASDRGLDVGPGHELRIDRLLHQAVVEKARGAVAVPVHGHEADQARIGIERLRKPGRIAGDFVRRWSAGHAAP